MINFGNILKTNMGCSFKDECEFSICEINLDQLLSKKKTIIEQFVNLGKKPSKDDKNNMVILDNQMEKELSKLQKRKKTKKNIEDNSNTIYTKKIAEYENLKIKWEKLIKNSNKNNKKNQSISMSESFNVEEDSEKSSENDGNNAEISHNSSSNSESNVFDFKSNKNLANNNINFSESVCKKDVTDEEDSSRLAREDCAKLGPS